MQLKKGTSTDIALFLAHYTIRLMARIKAVKIVSERFTILDSFGENIGYNFYKAPFDYFSRCVKNRCPRLVARPCLKQTSSNNLDAHEVKETSKNIGIIARVDS